MTRLRWPAVAAIGLLTICGCSKSTDPEPEPEPVREPIKNYTYTVVNEFPHDPDAFTQGLVYNPDGYMYEGTGLYGESTLRRVILQSGVVLLRRDIPPKPGGGTYFGEGIDILNGKIFQLTWLTSVGFIYSKATFDSIGQFSYPTEGWGLTHDSSRFIMSTGSAYLYFRDTSNLALLDSVLVTDSTGPVNLLNELEYIEGEVWANIWLSDTVARIDPSTGYVVGYVNLAGLLDSAEEQSANVLNGIAYDPVGKRIFVTGKDWPKLFEIEAVEVQ